MNREQFEAWLALHFPAQKSTQARLPLFVEQLQFVSGKPLSWKAAQAWVSRDRVPGWAVQLLPAIEARLANPEAAHVLTVPVALSGAELRALKRAAKQAGATPEVTLAALARKGIKQL